MRSPAPEGPIRQSIWLKYLVAIAAVMIGVGIRAALNPLLGEAAPLILFLPPVALAAWYGGFGPGMVATALAVFLGMTFFVPLHGPPATEHPYALNWMVRAFPFIAVGTILSYFAARLESARKFAADKERLARESEEFVRRVVTASPDCIKVLDLRGTLLSINDAGVRLLGLSSADSLLQTAWAELWKVNRALAVSAIEQASTGQSARYTALEAVQGEPKWWDVSVTPILGVDGRPERLLAISRDITERRQSDERLRHTEELQRRVFDSVSEFVIMGLDAVGTITAWSLGAQRIIGFTSAEAVGQSGSIIFTPEDRANDVPQQEMITAATDGRAADERWHLRKDGSRFFASGVMTPLRDDTGQLTGFIKIARDVTQQQQMILALDEAQRRSQSALLAAEMGTFEWNISSDFLHGDANFMRIFGIDTSATELKLERYMSKVHPGDRQRVREQITHSITTAEDFESEYRLIDALGDTSRWLLVRGRMTKDAGGKVVRFPGVVVDITDRRRIEEARKLDEERYRNLFNQIDEGFCVIKMLFDEQDRPVDFQFLEYNRAFENQSGLKNVAGRRIREIAPDHEQYWFDHFGKVALTGETIRFENKAQALERWYDVNAFRIGEPQQRLVAVLFKDITESRRREAERQSLLERESAARVAAEQASRMKDEFLATISHELRTPLAAIVGWASLLQSGRSDAAMINEGINVISRNASAQSQLIEDILDMSRITSGKVRLNTALIDLRVPLESAISTVANAAQAKQLSIVRELCDEPLLVSGDTERLQQVFWNLLANAIKFTDRLGTVRIRATLKDSLAVVDVIDSGKGMDADFLPYVFDRFRQADMSTTRRQGGLGLGLSIVRSLAELHGGSVSAFSEGPNRGSTFRIELPIQSQPDALPAGAFSPPKPRQAAIECPPIFVGKRVLVVDDEPDARRVIEAMLITCSIEVIAAASVSEAFSVLETGHPIDLIVSDIGMPDEDGYSFVRKLREWERQRGSKRVPAIALTAYTRPSDERDALAAGFDHFIAKPAEPDSLLRALQQALEQTANRSPVG